MRLGGPAKSEPMDPPEGIVGVFGNLLTDSTKSLMAGRKEIGLTVGKVLGRYPMEKHFSLSEEERISV